MGLWYWTWFWHVLQKIVKCYFVPLPRLSYIYWPIYFKESIPIYKEALKKSGFHEKLEHRKGSNEKKKRWKQKIINSWFNPPYSNNVKSSVGKQFLRLVRRHFPKGHKLNKIYSCTRSMSSILIGHNKKILAKNEKQYERNCRNKDKCPLENKYLTPQVIYEADVIILNTSTKFDIVLSDTPVKERYNNHERDFRNKRYTKSTELSKYIWSLRESGIQFIIHWKILSHVKEIRKRG